MQNIRCFAFEPLHIFFCAVPRNNTKACWHVGVKLCGVNIALEEIFSPEQWTIVQDGVVGGERHVVWQAWARQRHRCVVGKFTRGGENSVVHVWVRRLVVEKQQLAGVFINL